MNAEALDRRGFPAWKEFTKERAQAKGRALSMARIGLREAIEVLEDEGLQVAADEVQRKLNRSIELEEESASRLDAQGAAR